MKNLNYKDRIKELETMNNRLLRENYSYEKGERAFIVTGLVMVAIIIFLSVNLST